MYLTLTETTSKRTATRRRMTRAATIAATTTRAATRKTTPQPLIDAWARRAMNANGFGDAGC